MLAGTYLALLLLTSLPAFQSWSAGVASRVLSNKVKSEVSIGKLRLNMLGHAILDDVKLYDRRDTLMLQASRIAAKIDLLPLIEKKIRISGAQLIGAKAKIYKDGDEPFNFQFIVDAFSKKDTTSSPLDLAIGALVVRRGELQFDMPPSKPPRGEASSFSPSGESERGRSFDPKHLHLKDLSLTAKVHFIKPDSLSLNLRNLSFAEQSGLHLQHLSFEAEAGKHSASVQNFLLKLPGSNITADNIQVHAPEKWSMVNGQWSMLKGSLCPRDLACFIPKLGNFSDIINFSIEASLSDGTLRLPNISVSDRNGNIRLLCDATIQDIKSKPSVYADIHELRTGPALQQFLMQNLKGIASPGPSKGGENSHGNSPLPWSGWERLGSTKTTGSVAWQNRQLRTHLLMESSQGNVSIEGSLSDMKELEAKVAANSIMLGHLLGLSDKAKATAASLEVSIAGTIPGKDRQAKLAADGMLKSLTFRGYEHRNIPFSATIDGNSYSGEVTLDEPNGKVQVNGQCSMVNGKRSLLCQALLKDFAPYNMNLTERYEGERFNGNLDADFSDIRLNDLQGQFRLSDLQMASEERGTLRIGDITFYSAMDEDRQHLVLQSDFLNVRADGNINWKTLPASFVQPVRQSLPSLFQAGSGRQQLSSPTRGRHGNDFRFFVEACDTILAERLLDSGLRLPEKSTLEGTISDATGQISLEMNVPQLQMGNQQLQNIGCQVKTGNTSIQASLECERLIKGKPVAINLDARADNDKVMSRLRWDNKRDIAYTGNINMSGTILRDAFGQTVVDANIRNSDLVVGDTTWYIQPASIKYHDKVIDVEGLSISQADRHVNIRGRVSAIASDTLKVDLKGIDIAYIMDLVNFHKVDFDGQVTGNIYATSLMQKPYADAFLKVKQFTFNAADLGDMNLYANWGKQERAVSLEADMRGPLPEHRTQVLGTIIPGKGKDDGLNLNIETSRIDLAFLRKFTKGIFSNLEGRASGTARVFGPFKYVNLEGDMFINEFKTHVLATGTDYHLAGDSVIMRPDNIWIHSARIYDNAGGEGKSEHYANVDMHLMHNCFKNLSFNIGINAHNMLAYNFPQQGSMNFFGTAYADAQVEMKGKPGNVNIDIKATPRAGTVINYNTATSGTASEADFVTYTSAASPSPSKGEVNGEDAGRLTPPLEGTGEADLRLTFDIDANPEAQIRILMDPRSGDNITLYGNGRLLANYYNKGRFQLFGTYHVSDGNYRMSIRDLIRKDFTFQPNGTIIFQGNAMEAALNLQAKHTVPNVSLDDLSTTGLGLSNTRVDCIMNIGGIAREPVISFDFDIPNANEDEKQMVRSMLSSEEERDMQAVYLLGVGRFYSYGTVFDKKQNQGSMAMNSVLSSTLSSRFNQIMSQALGGTGWTFGTNLRTGEEGWERLDVEGLVSGKMFSGRLQFNGNFGYRENKYKMGRNNFIGDFDIQYRLSPRSPFSLKAYNQTNDRYFTQSSLTTQGIGIKFQRDFNRWQELFHRAKKKSKKK